jgi:hypothetical protein
MSQSSLFNETPLGPDTISSPLTWGGTLGQDAGHPTHFLHLMASPCEKCKGPVVAGWVCKREDHITQETEITGIGTICLSCGSRPDALIDPLGACRFRPVEWEWKVECKPAVPGPDGHLVPTELSRDADRAESAEIPAELQPTDIPKAKKLEHTKDLERMARILKRRSEEADGRKPAHKDYSSELD